VTTEPRPVLAHGTQVIVTWETLEQREWYGCPEGEVVSYDPRTQLYQVRHPDQTVLAYNRCELISGVLNRLIWKAQKNIIEKKQSQNKRITPAQQNKVLLHLQGIGIGAIVVVIVSLIMYMMLR
jgi:hypothetical protein